VESVAENSVDGFVSPLFYALLGGAPLALAYKAVNTLDSMIGYKNPHYQQFGWAAARLDDMANYIPARLMYILLPIASGLKKVGWVWQIMWRDGDNHPSPNSGLPESGFAAYLGIQLGGTGYYQGQANKKPLLGDDRSEPAPVQIKKAINLFYLLSGWAIALDFLWAVIF
jgi:adenosylcobinamide-phosphate synthase